MQSLRTLVALDRPPPTVKGLISECVLVRQASDRKFVTEGRVIAFVYYGNKLLSISLLGKPEAGQMVLSFRDASGFTPQKTGAQCVIGSA